MIKVEINGSSVIPRAGVSKIIRQTLRTVKIKSASVSVAFVAAAEIKKWNYFYRNKAQATDVLSFGFGLAAGDEEKWKRFGEILIAESVAKVYAKEKHIPLRQEITLLLVHGALHLAGYDHKTKKQGEKMFGLQNRILKNL